MGYLKLSFITLSVFILSNFAQAGAAVTNDDDDGLDPIVINSTRVSDTSGQREGAIGAYSKENYNCPDNASSVELTDATNPIMDPTDVDKKDSGK
jgi:hypothetical protein